MKKNEKPRITYAQSFLLDLLEKRSLRSWCMENNLEHSYMYRVAKGEVVPVYRVMSSLVHIIPPAHWLYFTDEEIPYEVKTVSEWDYRELPSFVIKHKRDYIDLSEKFGIPRSTAQNIFVTYRTKMSIEHMRMFTEIADPVEFFTVDKSLTAAYIPERGDIVSLATKTWLVLSSRDYNKKNSCIFAVEINATGKGVEVKSDKGSGHLDYMNVRTIPYSRLAPVFMGKVKEKTVESALKNVSKIIQ